MGLPDVSKSACPRCGSKTLTIVMKLVAKPIGTYSLSGSTMKISCIEWPYLECSSCDLSLAAKRDDQP